MVKPEKKKEKGHATMTYATTTPLVTNVFNNMFQVCFSYSPWVILSSGTFNFLYLLGNICKHYPFQQMKLGFVIWLRPCLW